MAFPQKVLDDIARGKAIYSELNQDRISNLQAGCEDCYPINYKCMYKLLESLSNMAAIGNYEETSQANYHSLILLIGASPDVVFKTGYFGSKSDKVVLTESQILAGTPFTFVDGQQFIIPYTNADLKINWFAIPNDQPIPNYYEDVANSLNKGHIGDPSDLFGAIIGVGSFFYDSTNYFTSQTTSLIIKST